MSVLFILPFFVSLYYVGSGQRSSAYLNVYLPCLFLTPLYYSFRIPHLPPLSVSEWALLPIGMSLLFGQVKQKYRRMDLWVILFLMSLMASEVLRETSPKDGFIHALSLSIQMFFPYVVGRRLIEPNLRLDTCKKMILLLLYVVPAMLIEAVAGKNAWLWLGIKIFGVIGGPVTQRNGHARVSGSLGGSIQTGQLAVTALFLNFWLVYMYKHKREALGEQLAKLESRYVPQALLVLVSILTQSRTALGLMPVGFLIAQVPKFRKMKFAGGTVLLLLVLGGTAVEVYLDRYTSPDNLSSGITEQQSSAIYRRQMIENYKPTIEQGGWLGWGIASFPRFGGQFSIDNNYMLIQLSQGKLGIYLFLLIVAESLLSTGRAAFTFRSPESRFFAFSLMAALVGLFLSLTTVFLSEQVIQVCFMLIGWSQSMEDVGSNEKSVAVAVQPQYQFKKVFT